MSAFILIRPGLFQATPDSAAGCRKPPPGAGTGWLTGANPRAKAASPSRTPAPAPRLPARHAVREAQFAPRTGPPPAGNEAAVSPSPPRPVRRADPRSTHANASVRTGPERTAGRTATHKEHAGTPRNGALARACRTLRTGGPPRPRSAGPGWSAPEAGRPCGHAPATPHRPDDPCPRPARGPCRARPWLARRTTPPLPHPPALPPLLLRPPPATAAPTIPRAFGRPAVRRRPPPRRAGRTTIPPYGRPPLNGRDAANYAGFTDVLSRAAYSSGLGQMRVRPECRGPSLGRTRYECRAPQR